MSSLLRMTILVFQINVHKVQMAIASQSKKLKDAKLSLKDVKVYLNLHSFLDVSFRACLLLSCFAVAD